jgi:hypothetical protein
VTARLEIRTQARIASLSTALSNLTGTTRLLAEIPELGEIHEKLAEPLLLQHWDEPTQRAIWVASDGSRVRCVTVTGLSVQEMADIWVSCNERLSRDRYNLSPQLVREIIEAEIDVSVVLVN